MKPNLTHRWTTGGYAQTPRHFSETASQSSCGSGFQAVSVATCTRRRYTHNFNKIFMLAASEERYPVGRLRTEWRPLFVTGHASTNLKSRFIQTVLPNWLSVNRTIARSNAAL
ncbi:hypothetical protein PGT21_024831 [Puccinia graminis f. sp. tritici]|uniref:Uncharacterized protein n=1 Tax=Puccinia graminis f. sp. tritici TaxID=56615 RepID=A0A5B0PRX8_PUCGR|nr:hypothetical protein PGT21_024831 [Puccinia graminis f. sp. tritici]